MIGTTCIAHLYYNFKNLTYYNPTGYPATSLQQNIWQKKYSE